MNRVFKSLSFQIILTALLIVGFSMGFLGNRLIMEFQQELISKEQETLTAVGSQAVERWNRMYRELSTSYKFDNLTQNQQDNLMRIFLSKSFGDYMFTFKDNFPRVGIGYQVPLFDNGLTYLSDPTRNSLSKLSVGLPLKAGKRTVGYLVVDRDMPQILAPIQRVQFEAFKRSTVSIGVSGLVTIFLLTLFLIRLQTLRRSVARLKTNLDAPIPHGGGELGEISSAVTDLARSLKRSIEEARQTEALKTLGTFTTGIAHEVRNPLTSIKGYANLLEKKLQGRPEAKYVAPISSEADRLEALVKDLLTFGRPTPLQPVEFDLRGFFEGLGELMHQQFEDEHVALDIEVPSMTVTWDARQSEQLFMNLFQNGIQSLHGMQDASVSVTARTETDRVVVEVRDNGSGIREEDKPKMFTPFFTTKEHGTGLGLPISQKIAALHSGVITFQSSEGQGATFIVNLLKVVKSGV